MIASLKGIVSLIDAPHIIVDVSGVGYKVLVPSGVLAGIVIGETMRLSIYTHVREDALDLFGFLHPQDLKVFEKLISVSGIGPKTAMGVFALGTHEDITKAVIGGDDAFFSGVPRLGRKNAQKIIIELKGKLNLDTEIMNKDGSIGHTSEITQALQHFGFTQKEAHVALQNIKTEGKTTEEQIKLALKYLGK